MPVDPALPFLLAGCLLAALSAPVLLASAYLLTLTILSGRPRALPPARGGTRFAMVVPAHDEAAGIERTVRGLLAVDWPQDRRRVIVVADNCSDETAALARSAGAEVIEREDASLRGKGYALKLAYERVLEEGRDDAIVVVDADSDVSPQLLAAFASRLDLGAEAVQAFYGVRNPRAGWRTRLVTIALAMFHRIRGRGRERLRLSCGLRGNGMCFTTPVLRRVPHAAFSRVEDLEYGVALGRAGVRVWYADEAEVTADMVVSEQASRSQRQRWEGGRWSFAKENAPALLKDGILRRDRVLLDLALDLFVPPLAYLMGVAILLWFAALGLWAFGNLPAAAAAWLALPLLFLCAHVARGVTLSGLGASGWWALGRAPFYLAWKLLLMATGGSSRTAWIRTAREPGKDEQT